MSSHPSISVAIPTYNGADFLRETIESVLGQSHTDFELVISDDGSTDATVPIAERYERADPRVRVDSHRRLGIGANWNRCLELARGTWTKVMGQDDLLLPTCLEDAHRSISAATRPTIAFARRRVLIDHDDDAALRWYRRYAHLTGPLEPLERVNDGRALLVRWIEAGAGRNLVGEPVTTVFRTDLARELGGFDTSMRQNLDLAMWQRLFARGEVCFSDVETACFRYHAGNASSTNAGRLHGEFEMLRVLRGWARDPELASLWPDLPRHRWAERRSVLRRLRRRWSPLGADPQA